jgi:hypothetical protein
MPSLLSLCQGCLNLGTWLWQAVLQAVSPDLSYAGNGGVA